MTPRRPTPAGRPAWGRPSRRTRRTTSRRPRPRRSRPDRAAQWAGQTILSSPPPFPLSIIIASLVFLETVPYEIAFMAMDVSTGETIYMPIWMYRQHHAYMDEIETGETTRRVVGGAVVGRSLL